MLIPFSLEDLVRGPPRPRREPVGEPGRRGKLLQMSNECVRRKETRVRLWINGALSWVVAVWLAPRVRCLPRFAARPSRGVAHIQLGLQVCHVLRLPMTCARSSASRTGGIRLLSQCH